MRPRSSLDTEADTWRPADHSTWLDLLEGGVSRARVRVARVLDTHIYLSLRPKGWLFDGPSRGLQYATFISAAQRGVLITRAAYDICEEEPVTMATLPVAKGGEPRKKMSLMDYHNKKKSASPVENGLSAAKSELKTNGTVHAKSLPPKDDGKKDVVKTTEKSAVSRQSHAPLERTRPESNGEGNKPSPVKPKVEHESRKRPADTDDNPSPQKRTKADANISDLSRSRALKPESPRGRPSTTERPYKDSKTETLHPTANGLPPSSFDRDREASASPRSTIQVNGSRARSNSGTPTPRKPENLTKAALPKLLSPLHPALFDHDTDKSAPPKKKPTSKTSTTEKAKIKKTVKIPEPLSPTLPPVIEEILADMKRKPTTSKEASSQQAAPDALSGARKTTIVAAAPGRPSVEDDTEKPSRLTKIVTLKLNKSTARRAKVLLSLPSKAAKEALRRERSTSVDTAPPVAKKRPAPADEAPQESSAPKRNKAPADVITARPPGPTTPLKPAATAMSRVTSSQSQGPGSTPAAGAGHTPDNRPPTRSEPLDPKTLAQAESYRERHAEYGRLGSRLKHARDDLRRDRGANMSPADERRATALHFEMILAYMVAFHSLNQARLLERRSPDIAAWESLLPHFSELRSPVSGNRALKALATQMHVVALEQITNGFANLEPAAAAGFFSRWTKHNRNRALLWGEAHALSERVDEARLRAPVGPWMTVDDAVAAALVVMRRPPMNGSRY
ncbi:hypothetical protein VTJ49DRAFT_2078 [Mycothermus thermophilus]|uniref:Uncharacterized protein n=1 Tax=Humicola insolens TaxID=85995 RepID=A0ABR3VAT1_HUMIN